MTPNPREPDWKKWLVRWDRQQEWLVPNREDRFNAMLDILGAAFRSRLLLVDLGCGPGSLSLRVLRRFSWAHALGVDFDPVLLRLGQGALGTVGGRMTWIEADLRRKDWTRMLPVAQVDAAVSTTALHWLAPRDLRRLYRDLYGLLRPGGILLNGDYHPSNRTGPAFRRLGGKVSRLRLERASRRAGWLDWRGWWGALKREQYLRPLFAVRRERFPKCHPKEEHLPLEAHLRALRRAGFREVGTLRQDFDDRVVFAIR